MKLVMNRREAKEGLIFKSTVYYLDITLETTPDEMALIKKHKWEDSPMGEGKFISGAVIQMTVSNLAGRTSNWGFKTAEHLAFFEDQVIKNAKELESRLKAAAGFSSGGPREIEL